MEITKYVLVSYLVNPEEEGEEGKGQAVIECAFERGPVGRGHGYDVPHKKTTEERACACGNNISDNYAKGVVSACKEVINSNKLNKRVYDFQAGEFVMLFPAAKRRAEYGNEDAEGNDDGSDREQRAYLW